MHLEFVWIFAIHGNQKVDPSARGPVGPCGNFAITAHEGVPCDLFEPIDGNKSPCAHLCSLSLVQRDIKYISPSHLEPFFSATYEQKNSGSVWEYEC